MLANNEQINWLPEHIKRRPVRQFSRNRTSIGPSRANATGARRCRSGSASRPARWKPSRSYDELLAKPGVSGTEVWDEAKKAKPELPDDLKVHKPYIDAVTYDSPFATGARMRRVTEVIDCWFDSGAMPFAQWGYPHAGSDEQFNDSSPPTSSAKPSTRPAAGSTANWRSARCCSATRTVDERVRRIAAPHSESTLSPSVPQLHRARPDARRRRPEDVARASGTTASRTKSSTATAPMPCAGTSSPTSRRGRRSATTSRRSRTASPSSCCGCGTSTASS